MRYGMAVFETIRVVAGHAQFWELHADRIKTAALQCGFWVSEGVLADARNCIGGKNLNGVARLYVTAGDGGPADPVLQSRVALLLEERQRILPSAYSIAVCPEMHLPLFKGLKTANYWSNASSLRDARVQGANEALLSNPAGTIVGCCMANVFLHTQAAGWITPSLSTGARQGVVREWAMERLDVQEAEIHASTLDEIDAGFLTSSWVGIMPIGSLLGRVLSLRSDATDLRQTFETLPVP